MAIRACCPVHLQDLVGGESRGLRNTHLHESVSSALFEAGSALCCSLLHVPHQLAFKLWGSPLLPISLREHQNYIDVYYCLQPFQGPGDLNSDSHTCMTGDLPTKQSPWSLIYTAFLTFVSPRAVSDRQAVSYWAGEMARQLGAHTALSSEEWLPFPAWLGACVLVCTPSHRNT